MKSKFLGCLDTLKVNSSFFHIVFHIKLMRMGRQTAKHAFKGIGREFTRFYLI
jgi:hypothetical protein